MRVKFLSLLFFSLILMLWWNGKSTFPLSFAKGYLWKLSQITIFSHFLSSKNHRRQILCCMTSQHRQMICVFYEHSKKGRKKKLRPFFKLHRKCCRTFRPNLRFALWINCHKFWGFMGVKKRKKHSCKKLINEKICHDYTKWILVEALSANVSLEGVLCDTQSKRREKCRNHPDIIRKRI